MSDKKNSIWSFFSSVKLTFALLIAIILSSVLGTLIPQHEAAESFMNRLSPGVIDVAQKLQLFDIYHSMWFIMLMVLLTVNLIICSANRWPVSWKRFRETSIIQKEYLFKDLPPDQTVMSARPVDTEAPRVEGILKKRYTRVRCEETEGGIFITGEKGNASYLGVYVVHASILIVLAGTMIGFLWGFDGYMEIPEDEATDTVVLKRGKGYKTLDFTIRCDRFSVEYYTDGTPKEYRSELSFKKNDNILQQDTLLVNHPATFAGIRFYQASYGTVPSDDALIVVHKGRNQKSAIKVAVGNEFDLPEKEGKARILRMEENFMRMGPAVKLQIQSAQKNVQFWVFQNIEDMEAANPGLKKHVPMFNPGLFSPYVFSLIAIQPKHYTGLQVNYDPGLPAVIGGAFSLVAGFFIVFFYAHRQVWIRIDRQGVQTRISVSGKSNKDQTGLGREISHLIKKIQNMGADGA